MANLLIDERFLLAEQVEDMEAVEENITAENYQQRLYEFLGYDTKVIWDAYNENQKDLLELKIRSIIGNSNEDNNLKLIETLWKHHTYGGGHLFMSPIYVLCVSYEEYKDNLDLAHTSTQYSIHPVFRIRKCVYNPDNRENPSNDHDNFKRCVFFVDENARVYASWNQFLKTNILPKAVIITPKCGIYRGQNNKVLLEVHQTPACSKLAAFFRTADPTSALGSLVSTAAIITGTIAGGAAAALLLAGGTVVGTTCAAYSFARSTSSLNDRANHQQSISLRDTEARSSWLCVAGSIAALAASSATKLLSYYVQNGRNIGMVLTTTTNFANGAAIATNAIGIVHGGHAMFMRSDNTRISTLEKFQLATSIFLLTHSVYTFQSANNIIEANQNATISEYRQSLSRRQRKMFDKMSKETVRTNGGQRDIIRFMRNSDKTILNDAFKLNPRLNNENIRISFGSNGDVLLNGVETNNNLRILRNEIQTNPSGNSLLNVPRNIPDGNPAATVNSRISSMLEQTPSNQMIPSQITLFLSNYQINDEEDFGVAVNYIFGHLDTVTAFKILIDLVEEYMTEYNDRIENILHQNLPFEQYLRDIFDVIKLVAEGQNKDITVYLDQGIDSIRNHVIRKINEFYDRFQPKYTKIENCKSCQGQYYS